MKFLTSDEIVQQVKEMVQRAEGSVKIASAWIKGRNFAEILDVVGSKNVSIEIILRASEFRDLLITDEGVFRKIKEVGGRVYLCGRLHAKFIVVDEREALVGSANFTDAGLSDLSSGNIEAGVFYRAPEKEEEVKKLVAYFEKVKREFSESFEEGLLGFALNPVKTESFEFVLIDENLGVQSYVEVRLPEGKILGRVTDIYAYDMGFFANPFTSNESPVFAPLQDFREIFTGEKEEEWKKAAVYAYLHSNGSRLRIATAAIQGLVRNDGRLDMVCKPFDVGTAIYSVSRSTLEKILRRNFSGQEMRVPVRVGVLKDSELEVFIDAQEVINKHLLVIGTTGSGKSYFVKHFISELAKNFDVEIFVLDPHGEYAEFLVSRLGPDYVEHLAFEDVFFPAYAYEVVELLKEGGFSDLVSGNSKEARKKRGLLEKLIKPALNLTKLSQKNLFEILEGLEIEDTTKEEIKEYLRETYGEEVISGQPGAFRTLVKGLESGKRVVIFDFRDLTHPFSRINLAGMAMLEIFQRNKRGPKERIIVLEEAHNFAPERGFGDVSAGGDNLALLAARKIASEGRKFNLGLIAITQRPAQVSKYVLSQMNTQAMFRTVNASDIGAIATLIESAGEDISGILPSLSTGTGILTGLGVPFPIVVEVR